jgi:hypothetical protein
MTSRLKRTYQTASIVVMVLMKSNIKASGELKPAFTLHSQLLSSLTPPYLDLLAKIDFISK